MNDPAVNNGKKIILVDTDHCAPWDHEPEWVWKNLFRGNQFLLMDGYVDYRIGSPPRPDVKWEPMRHAMGRVRAFAEHLDLAILVPRPDLASTGYCLVSTSLGKAQYVVYVLQGKKVTVQLDAVNGPLDVEWMSVTTGKRLAGEPVVGGIRHEFISPLSGPAILRCFTVKENGD